MRRLWVMAQRIGNRCREIYTDVRHPASFSHPLKVLSYLRKEAGMSKVKLGTVKQALSGIASYSQFKPLRQKFPKMTTRSDDVDDRWQVDLMNIIPYGPESNDGFRFFLVTIDVFSRRLVVVPMYDKSAKEVTEATELIFMTEGKVPRTIASDSGQEFRGRSFKRLCSKYGIDQFFTIPDVTHATVVERVIATLRLKIGKYMKYAGSNRFIDAMPAIVDSYNNSIHSTIAMAPNQVDDSLVTKQLALFHLKDKLEGGMRLLKDLGVRHRRIDGIKQRRSHDERTKMRVPLLPSKRFRKIHEPRFSESLVDPGTSLTSDKHRRIIRLVRQDGSQVKHPKSWFDLSELSAA